MDWRRLLLIVGVVGLTFTYPMHSSSAAAAQCSQYEASVGACVGASIGQGEVVIGGSYGTGDGGTGGGGGTAPEAGDETSPADGPDLFCADEAACIANRTTIEDLARFAPGAPSISMEPDGWMLVGLPANFIATSSERTVSGTLFTLPVTVRFTPTAYRWDWGDGTSTTSATGGARWADLGLTQFSQTPTSHVYTHRGTYSIGVSISYSAEFSVNGLPFRSVSGTVTSPVTATDAVARTAKTVIVDRDCSGNPSGPGC